jgi:23S rRNA (adenine-N6)-dimethyltransferase
VSVGDLVVDVGAGTGVLTRALTAAGARVVALEVDPALVASLRKRFARDVCTVVEADACTWEWPREPFSVLSNLPFSGSSAILTRLLHDPRTTFERADVIVQWGLAVKHAALWPATLKGTYWRAWYELAPTRRLSRTAFVPAPDVEAAVLRVRRRSQPLVDPEQHEEYWRFLCAAFREQAPLRRTLGRHLSQLELRRLGDVLGFSANGHPRDLDACQWAAVFSFSNARAAPPKTGRRTRSK